MELLLDFEMLLSLYICVCGRTWWVRIETRRDEVHAEGRGIGDRSIIILIDIIVWLVSLT